MPYIPEEHKQYPVLLYTREHGGEVFQYRNLPTYELLQLIGEQLMPYGYASYEEYYGRVNRIIEEHSDKIAAVNLLNYIKEEIQRCNQKEYWSICRYVGEDTDEALGLHHGGYYYWPCIPERPEFGGVIDDEEFTAYLYPTDPDLWEIIIDPTGMAHRTIYEGQNAQSLEDYDCMMEQIRT